MSPMTNAEKQAAYRQRRKALEAGGDTAVASLVRACIATGIARLDSSVRPSEYAKRTWDDQCVDLILRAAVSPAAVATTPALTQISAALLDALVPASAGSDLLNRGVKLNFA